MGDSLRCCQSLSSTPSDPPANPGQRNSGPGLVCYHCTGLTHYSISPGRIRPEICVLRVLLALSQLPQAPHPHPTRRRPCPLRLIWARFCAVLAQLPIYPSPARRFLHSTAAESVPVLPATRRTPPPPGPTRGSSASPPSAHFSLGEASGTPGRVSGPVAGAHGRAAEASPGRLIQARFCACSPPPSRSRRARERREQAACHCWCPAPARSARPAVPTGPAPRLLLRPPRGRDAAAPASSRVAPAPRGQRERSAREQSALRRPRPAVCRRRPGGWGRAGPGAAPPGGGGLRGRPGCRVNPSPAAVRGRWEVAWAHTCRLRRGRGAAGEMRAAGAASGGSASPQPPEL